MIQDLYNSWLQYRNLRYESIFDGPIVKAFCNWQSSLDNGREEKGRLFNAGYEVFLYAFFIELYRNSRRTLSGQTRSFSMEIFRWGDVNSKYTTRKKYKRIQEYLFAAAVAKSDLDLVKYDLGEIETAVAVSTLADTINEIANAGFYEINQKMNEQDDFFFNVDNLLSFVLGEDVLQEAQSLT